MQRLDRVIRETLELGPDTDLDSISYRNTATWDSVGHLELLTAIEEEFGLVLEPDELMGMTDYQGIVMVIAQRTGRSRQ